MDLSRATNEKKLHLCKLYFIAGFFLLPFVWTINAFWFFDEAFFKVAYPEQATIRKLVIASAIASLLWLLAIITWVTMFQLNRVAWGEWADSISFIIPLGSV